MLVQKLLYWQLRKKISNDWEKKAIPHSLLKEYKKLEPTIERCYAKATHWHGTGRYHYQTQGESKYEGINAEKTVDVLSEIIKVHGLKVHQDPWIRINKAYSSSISTTRWRMYARAYAELHMDEEKELAITFGQRKDIVNFFVWYSLLSAPPKAIFNSASSAFDKKRYATKMPEWAKTINNKIKSKGNAYIDMLHVVGTCKSNIRNNYPILIGIDAKNLKQAKVNPIIAMFETRFTENIRLENITHIEVPANKVPETREMLKRNKINIIVLPIELCEIYSSRKPIRLISGDDKLPSFTYQQYIEYYK